MPLITKFLYVLLVLILAVVLFIVIERWRIVRNLRKVSDRIELLSDIKGWINFFTLFVKNKRK
jgi:hypothetical protein